MMLPTGNVEHALSIAATSYAEGEPAPPAGRAWWVRTRPPERVAIYEVEAPDGRRLVRMLRERDLLQHPQPITLELQAVQDMVAALRAGAPSNAAPELFRVGGVDCPVCGGMATLIERSPDGVRCCKDGHEWRVRQGVAVPEESTTTGACAEPAPEEPI